MITPKTNYIRPFASYNADLDKKRILSDNKGKIGIYRWVNLINGKTYIGSSAEIRVRLYKYYSAKHLVTSQLPIVKALLKYGYSNFQFDIIEYCSLDNLIEREQYYLDTLKPEYNILQIAGTTSGYKHNDATLELFKNRVVSDDTKKLLSLAATGRILSDEDKLKISEARKGIILSDETRKKISMAITSQIGIRVKVKNTITLEEFEYSNLTEAGKALNVSRTAIKKALVNGKLLKNTFLVTPDQENTK